MPLSPNPIKPVTAIGLLGPTLDVGRRPKRWERWRPTISLCMQEDLPLARLDLLYQKKFSRLLDQATRDIAEVSPQTRVIPHAVAMDDPWDFEEVFALLHDFALAYPFEPDENDYLVHISTGSHVAQICLFLLTEARYFPARLVQTGPSPENRKDPKGVCSVIDLDLSRYDKLAARFEREAADDVSFLKSGIDTRNAGFNALMEKMERVASRSVDPILITGPTGAGKSRLARRIFELKKIRRQIKGDFVEVNCATLRGDAAMSALFGHKKGAFTGALQDREGLLRAADKGLLFLDEVGELGMDEQSMLLMAIEEKVFFPMGSDRETSSDFQLVCGTNKNLGLAVEKGAFREDLLARINLWTFGLPGLKDRPEDVEPNLDYELARFGARTGKRAAMNKQARADFLKFAVSSQALWKANFRDLSGAVTRMATLAPGGRITMEEVREETGRLLEKWEPSTSSRNRDKEALAQCLSPERLEALDPFDRSQLAYVLEACRESSTLSDAGRRLFSQSRKAKKSPNDADRLRKYLAKFGLDWSSVKAG